MLGEDIADIVLAIGPEDWSEPLRPVYSLSGKSVNVFSFGIFGWFLAVADHVYDWGCLE